MQPIRTLIAAILLVACAAPAFAQTIKTLGYNTTNGQVVYSGTNGLTFINTVTFGDDASGSAFESSVGTNSTRLDDTGLSFGGAAAATTRANLGFSTNLNTLWTSTNASNARSAVGLGATWLTNTNVTNFRSAIGLGATNNVYFQYAQIPGGVTIGDIDVNGSGLFGFGGSVNLEEAILTVNNGNTDWNLGGSGLYGSGVIAFANPTNAATTRTNLGLGGANIVTFAGLTNNGDITINQTTTNNGLLYIRRTNNEAFLGLANLLASNNVTVSNETLFRVGVAEATNKAAQFGFRATNTNGTGVAVFSTFGNNALMMIGASDRSQTNAAIEADIWTISPTNRVMTLRDTNTGAMTMHRDIGFAATLTNAAPTNTTNVAVWLRVWVGTNSYRLPLYQ